MISVSFSIIFKAGRGGGSRDGHLIQKRVLLSIDAANGGVACSDCAGAPWEVCARISGYRLERLERQRNKRLSCSFWLFRASHRIVSHRGSTCNPSSCVSGSGAFSGPSSKLIRLPMYRELACHGANRCNFCVEDTRGWLRARTQDRHVTVIALTALSSLSLLELSAPSFSSSSATRNPMDKIKTAVTGQVSLYCSLRCPADPARSPLVRAARPFYYGRSTRTDYPKNQGDAPGATAQSAEYNDRGHRAEVVRQ